MSNTITSLPLQGQLSLVMPAHNEAPNMPELMAMAVAVLPTLATSYEIVLVDDGSTDGTGDIARESLPVALRDRLRIVRHEEKSGYGISVADGLRAAHGDFIAFCDSDLQFDLADFAKLAVHLGDHDLVTGRRAKRADNWKRHVTSEIYNFVVRRLYQVRFPDIDCAMKIMTRHFLDTVSPIVSRSATINVELYVKARENNFRVLQLSVPHYYRTAGVRSGGRLKPVIRAIKELIALKGRMASADVNAAAVALPLVRPSSTTTSTPRTSRVA